MSQTRRGGHRPPALMNVYTYIFDVMKIVYSILHAMRAIVCIAHERENTVLLYRIVQMVTILRSGINVFMQNKSNCEDLSFKRLFYLRAFCGTQ